MHFSENYAIILSVLSASPPDTKRISAWGISTVGSARHSHCRGQEFESPMLHGWSRLKSLDLFFCFRKIPQKADRTADFSPARSGAVCEYCWRLKRCRDTDSDFLPRTSIHASQTYGKRTNAAAQNKIKFHIQNTHGFPTGNKGNRTEPLRPVRFSYSSSPPMASFSVRQPSTAHFTRAGMCEMSFSAPASSSSSISSAVASP